MREISCDTIRDILPLYVDDVVSASTKGLVSEHLAGCASCRQILDGMKRSIPIPIENDSRPLKKIKRKLVVQRLLIACVSIITATAALYGLLWIPAVRVPYDESSTITAEIQQKEGNYLDQEFVMHILTDGGLNVQSDLDYVLEEDQAGHSTVTGVVITLREPIISFGNNSSTVDFSWGYDADESIDSDFDYTVTVEFRNKSITYSMREMGLFDAQNGKENS